MHQPTSAIHRRLRKMEDSRFTRSIFSVEMATSMWDWADRAALEKEEIVSGSGDRRAWPSAPPRSRPGFGGRMDGSWGCDWAVVFYVAGEGRGS